MFYFERKKHAVFLLYLFMGICLLPCSFFFFADLLIVFLERHQLISVTKCSILDVEGVLNLPQYAPTWIAYTNNLI